MAQNKTRNNSLIACMMHEFYM